MAIDINMQLSHMIADDLGAAGIEAAIIDTLFVQKGGIKETDLSALIADVLKIEVADGDIQKSLRNLSDNNRVYREHELIYLTPDTITELKSLIKNNTSLEEAALIQWYEDYIILAKNISEDNREIIINALRTFICRFFLTHGADCYSFIAGKKNYDEAKTEAIAQETVDKLNIKDSSTLVSFLSGIFTKEFTDEQQSFLLLQFKKAVHYLSMVVSGDTKRHLFASLNGLTLYLDTSILYRLFNLQGEHRFNSMKSVIKYCKEAGIKLKVLQVTVDELKRRIRYDSKIIERHPIPVSFAAIGYNARTADNYISTYWNERKNTGISAEDFNFRYSDVIALLGQYDIEIDETDYVKEKQLDNDVSHLRNKVAEYGTFKDDQKSENAIEHDSVVIATVGCLQRKNSISAIESEVLFLSTDWSLIRLQRMDHDYKSRPDFAVLPSQLLQLFSMTTTTIDYYDAFIGLFSSSRLSFGAGQLNNSEIQQIMGRVSAYSSNPELAKQVLSNQLIQRKFSAEETEEEKNEVIDEAILAEIEAMEERINLKDQRIKETEDALNEKSRLLEQSNIEAAETVKENKKIQEELEKAKTELQMVSTQKKELEEIVSQINQKKESHKRTLLCVLSICGVVAMIVGIILLGFAILSFIPSASDIIEPIWRGVLPSFEEKQLSRGDLINMLIVVGPLLMGGGFALFKWCYNVLKGGKNKEGDKND